MTKGLSTVSRSRRATIPRCSVTLLTLAAALDAGCIADEMPASHICDEIGSALASRAFACTGKTGEGNDVYEKFEDTYACLVEDYQGDEFSKTIGGIAPEQAFACPEAIRELACDAAKPTDIAATLAATPAACASFVTPK